MPFADPARRKAYRKAYRLSPAGKYADQKFKAKARGIAWLFTFESWSAWWGEDLCRRGHHFGQLVMARRDDIGPYSPDNCYKARAEENTRDGGRLGMSRRYAAVALAA